MASNTSAASLATALGSTATQNNQWGPQGIGTVVFGCVPTVLTPLSLFLTIRQARRHFELSSTAFRQQPVSSGSLRDFDVGDNMDRRMEAGNAGEGETHVEESTVCEEAIHAREAVCLVQEGVNVEQQEESTISSKVKPF